MDEPKNTQAEERDVRDLTKVIKSIDINDPKRKKNETQMRTTDGKICKFTEP